MIRSNPHPKRYPYDSGRLNRSRMVVPTQDCAENFKKVVAAPPRIRDATDLDTEFIGQPAMINVEKHHIGLVANECRRLQVREPKAEVLNEETEGVLDRLHESEIGPLYDMPCGALAHHGTGGDHIAVTGSVRPAVILKEGALARKNPVLLSNAPVAGSTDASR